MHRELAALSVVLIAVVIVFAWKWNPVSEPGENPVSEPGGNSVSEPGGNPASAPSETPDVERGVTPDFLIGEFEDDYGNRLTITQDTWTQHPGMAFHVAKWDTDAQFMVGRNYPANSGDMETRESQGIPPDSELWTRIDWVTLPEGGDYEWAFCISEYRALSREAAEAATIANPLTPRTGCNGFPFSRMKRVTSEN